LPALHSAGQPARYATAHSQQDHSPTDQPTVITSTATYLLTLTLAYDDQVEPLPAPDILGDLLLFLRASSLALIFNSLLVLPVESNSNDSTVLGEQQSQLTSYQCRKVGLSEKEREWPMGSQLSYGGDSPVQRNSTGPPAAVTVTAQPSHHQHPVFPKRLFGAHLRAWSYSSSCLCAPRPSISLVLDFTAQPRSPTGPSPTHASSAAHAIYRKADRAPTCVYRLLSSPICQLGSHIHQAFSLLFFPMTLSESTLPSPSSLPHPRRHVFVAGIAVSTSRHLVSSSSKHHPWSIILCLRQTTGSSYFTEYVEYVHDASARNATATPTQPTLTSNITNTATTMTPSGIA